MEHSMGLSVSRDLPTTSRFGDVRFYAAEEVAKAPVSEPVTCGSVGAIDGFAVLCAGIWAAGIAGAAQAASTHIIASVALLGAILGSAILYLFGSYRIESLR